MENKSVLIEYFGDTPLIRVIDFFIENDIWDYSKTDISEHTGVARTTLQELIKFLLNGGTIIETRNIGRASMFKLNKTSSFVKELLKFDFKLAKLSVQEETNKVLAMHSGILKA